MKASDYTILATSERYREAAAFWRRQLDDPAALFGSLPPVPSTAAAGRQVHPLQLPAYTTARLHALANDTLGRFTVLTAGIALALARYTNRSSVLLRTPVLADDIAIQVNDEHEVPLVFTTMSAWTLREFLEHTADMVARSYEHQDFPIRVLGVEERACDVAAQAAFSLSCSGVHADSVAVAAMHFTLDAMDDGRVAISFDTSVVHASTVEAIADVIVTTLHSFDDLGRTVRDIKRLPADQRERVTRTWSAGPTADVPFRSTQAWFEARVRLSPDNVALQFGDDTWSYRELDARANGLARYLASTIRDSEQAIGIWMDRSPWMVVAVLGVMKAGLAYVPIDADCPAERLDFLIRDSGVARLLIDSGHADAAAACGCDVVVADHTIDSAPTGPAITVGPSDLAYILYTSGSTGRPKGCAIEHHSLSNYLEWAVAYYWTTAETGTMALFTPLAFDLTVPSLFCPLLRGRPLVIFPQDAAIDDMLHQQFDAASPVDSVKLTPSHIQLLDPTRIRNSNVDLAIVGGEALTQEHVARLHHINPRMRVINEYGPTETTVGCIVKEIVAGAPIVIGRPIANTSAYVLDDDQRPVPCGIKGELCIGGAGVARGYLNRPDLEAERFLPNPFAVGDRIYRTGDIARWRTDGDLECFGRIDSQVKVRGYRIEPGEVEAALLQCDGIREAVVIAAADELVAYVISDQDVDPASLRRVLGTTLPGYMVPTTFVRLAQVPLTHNGKVDRTRLPAPSVGVARLRPFITARTAQEVVLARIWAEVLRRDRVSVDDNFFELGGHSLRAMTIIQRIHQDLGLDVSVGEVLAHPTIGDLAAVLATKAPSEATRIPNVPRAAHYVTSHGQHRLWLIDRIDDASPAYNISAAFDLAGALDLQALQVALSGVVARHESLRTVFIEVQGEPRQQVADDLAPALDERDLRSDDARDVTLTACVAAQASTPFDLARGPLLRVAVIRLRDDHAVLAITMHHIISDAWSMRVLMAEIIARYDNHRAGTTAPLPPLALQYRDYASWQRAWMESAEADASRAYWKAKLGGELPPLLLQTDRPRPPLPTYRGRHLRRTMDATTSARLRALAVSSGASPFMTLVAVVKALLYRYSGQSDIRVGSPIAGRPQPELADQIGFFVNTLVLRDHVRGDESFDALLTRVKQTAEDGYTHQAYPFDRLVTELGVPRDLSRTPLFDVMVVHDAGSDAAVASGGFTVTELQLETGVSKFDLTFAFAETTDGIDLEIEYSTDLFESDRIDTMSRDVIRIAEQVGVEPATRLDDLLLSHLADLHTRPPVSETAIPRPATAPAGRVAPRDERELRLIATMESTLGRSDVSVLDNFFHIGGDSIKAIQVVNRLARHGWTLRVRDVFEAPELAALARRMTSAVLARTHPPAEGAVPLTPIQRWFFQTQPEGRNHFNQSVLLRFDDRVDPDTVRAIGQALVQQHDALRLRFVDHDGVITQSYGAPYDPVEVHDLRASPAPDEALSQATHHTQASLNLEHGPLCRFLLCQLPDGDRLLAVVHHLVVDGVSWRILLEDLRTGLDQAARGEPIALSAATDSYQAWARALEAHQPEAALEARWWQEVDHAPIGRLPFDAEPEVLFESDVAEQRLTLDAAQTQALLAEVHHAYNTRTQDVLLAGLMRALRDWAGPGPQRVDVESHGREGLEGVEVSRTVGWFTALFPVVLDISAADDEGAVLAHVKDALKLTPGHGLGYGLLRQGRPSGAPVLFNFLGQFDTDLGDLKTGDEARGPETGPRTRLTHALTVGGWVSEGRLRMTVRYSRAQFHDATVARLVSAYQRALERLIAHCRTRTTHGRTLSDFRYTDASTSALVRRVGVDRVMDVYPMSPTQLGMVYHDALEVGSGVYLEQLSCSIRGKLDIGAFRSAWEQVTNRHGALRTACFWQDVERPVQVVVGGVDIPWVVHDWRHLPTDEQETRLELFAERDRHMPLALHLPPLFRLALIRLTDDRCRFFWTWHHLILDGWSTAIVLQEVFAGYEALVSGTPVTLAPVRQFGEYIDWLGQQDKEAARRYWHTRLADVAVPTPLPSARPSSSESSRFLTVELALSADATERIVRTVREHGLTLNTLARGAWALLLAAHSTQHDVLFGVTVSGRPPDLRDVESMVGLFINTVPIRVRAEATTPLVTWLQRIQVAHADLDQHASLALTDIQQQSGVPPRIPLFESLLVFENYPVDQSIDPGRHALSVDDLHVTEHTNYPLTLMVVPGTELLLRLSCDVSRYDATTALGLLTEVRDLFESFAANPNQIAAPASDQGTSVELAIAGAGALAAQTGITHAQAIEALVAIVCFHYSAAEDLHCTFGARRLQRGDLAGDRPFGDVVRALAATPHHTDVPTSTPADLQFTMVNERAASAIHVSCHTGRFNEPFLRRITSHIATLIASIEADPTTPIARLSPLSAEERGHVLDDFNRTDREWGPHRTIAQYFEEQALRHPDHIAVVVPAIGRHHVDTDETWTYGALNARANQLAHLLVREYGVGPDVRVGVLAERSFEMVLALMAVEKAGGAYVPLDPDYPNDLLRFMCGDAGTTVILTQPRLAELASELGPATVILDQNLEALSREGTDNLPCIVSPDHLAYVIYTSGSTGRPKGAMNTHHGITNRLLWMQDAYPLTAADRVLQKTPFSFDVSVWEFFWPLMVGAQLVVAKPGGHRDAAYLVALIEAAGITTLHFVPSMLQAFIDEPGVERCRTLARVICSGEALVPELLRRYRSRLPVPLHNLYGPTEAAVDVTAWTCGPADAETMVPIGRPIANIRLYIVNEAIEPVPLGVTGELLLGGVGVGRGYLNRPELTTAKFIEDPFVPSPGARLYRTGDLARYREDGVVDFLGRVDHQVKLRGFRIELGEIESALLSHPGVRECVVIVREDQPGAKRLVGYVVPSDASGDIPADLATHLHRHLPAHMVPGALVALPELPRLTNGKLNRNALPAVDTVRQHGRKYVAPRDGIERRLVQVWEDVLGQRMVGVTDDFFDRGGHSILALKLVGAIHGAFGRSVPLAQVLEHPTIERLAVALKGADNADAWRPLVEIRRGTSEAPLFLLPGAGGNVVYFHTLAQRLATTRPVYGLQAVGLDGITRPFTTVEAIAALNIDEMQRVWPHGPYLLAGHSFGGRVAVEMAQQLKRRGHTVALLAAFDTTAPTFTPDITVASWTDTQWLWKIAREIEEFFGISLALTLEDLQPLTLEQQLSLVIEQMQAAGAWAPGADRSQLRGYLEVYKANSQAAYVNYDSHVARVPIALFKAQTRDADLEAVPASLTELTARPDWGWQSFADGPVRVFDVPGAHLSMLAEPHVTHLARALDEVLNAIEAQR